MARERKPTSDRKTEIADAALHVIARQGIAALTMATLAAELGVTAGALFRHFESREAILDAVAVRVVELLDASFPSEDLPPAARLEAFVRARTAVVGQAPGLARLLLSEQFALALPERSVARIQAAIEKSRGFVVRALRDAAARGEVRADLPPEDLAAIVMGTMQLLVSAARATAPMVRRHPERVWRTLRALMASRPGDKR
jgi:AcrR family transcriptional regulator